MVKKNATAISIPLWYDWELHAAYTRGSCSYFNSTMVRLGVYSGSVLAYCLRYFNSTMVRLGVEVSSIAYPSIVISIPLWYDWEFSFLVANF